MSFKNTKPDTLVQVTVQLYSPENRERVFPGTYKFSEIPEWARVPEYLYVISEPTQQQVKEAEENTHTSEDDTQPLEQESSRKKRTSNQD